MHFDHESHSLFASPRPELGRRNPGYARIFRPGQLTLGLMFPIEAFDGDMPAMHGQAELARVAQDAGFAALWVRDVPLRVPSFGDTGQVHDPWVWLGVLAARTSTIALATGSIILNLRHPVHVAKAAASVDRLSGGRLVLGVASGDRPQEMPAFATEPDADGSRFRERFLAVRELLEGDFPALQGSWGEVSGVDLVPKPYAQGIPMIVTGQSRQTLDWIAAHADGWITYPRDLARQAQVIGAWQAIASRSRPDGPPPFAQSLYIDLLDDPSAAPLPMHLGFRLGRRALVAMLKRLEALGAGHVALNLKYGSRPAAEVVDELAHHVLPAFGRALPEAA